MTKKLQALRQLLADIMLHHNVVVFQWSGGKDSTMLLHLLRPWRTQVQVVSNIVDGGFEGVEEHIVTTAAAWGFEHLHLVKPYVSFDAYVEWFGMPSRLVPTAMDGTLPDPWYDGGAKVASFWHCTTMRVLVPLLEKTLALGAQAVITGSRADDAPVFQQQGMVVTVTQRYQDGFVRYNPLHHWTAAEVYAYIDEHHIVLPAVAQEKRRVAWEFPDCVLCPYHQDYVQWLAEHRPDDYRTMQQRFAPVVAKAAQYAQDAMATWDSLKG